jgi:protein-S-isoprenylcysteine O-methyltransferase Ste14
MNGKQAEKGPVAWAWLATVLAAVLLLFHVFLDRGPSRLVRAVGIGALLLSVCFMFPPFVLLKRYGRPRRGRPYFCATTVVDRGVYRIVRHPQYVGYVLLVSGFAALSQHPVSATLAVLSACAFCLQALEEEKFCQAQFGESYRDYVRRVPRFNFLVGLVRYLASIWKRA